MGIATPAEIKEMEAKHGTPSSLTIAIEIGLSLAMRMRMIPGRDKVHSIIKDYLAQRFGAAFLMAEAEKNQDKQIAIAELWEAITGERYGNS